MTKNRLTKWIACLVAIICTIVFADPLQLRATKSHADDNWQYLDFDEQIHSVYDGLSDMDVNYAEMITTRITEHDGSDAANLYWECAKIGDFSQFYSYVGVVKPVSKRKEYMINKYGVDITGWNQATFLMIETTIFGTTLKAYKDEAAALGYDLSTLEVRNAYIMDQAAGKIPIPSNIRNRNYNNNNSAPVAAAPATQTDFTVEDADFDGWAISAVNLREGADTTWGKIGGLATNEHVKVTGIASTGWYRVLREDGSEGYVSNKYISKENTSGQVVNRADIPDEDSADLLSLSYVSTDLDSDNMAEPIVKVEVEEDIPDEGLTADPIEEIEDVVSITETDTAVASAEAAGLTDIGDGTIASVKKSTNYLPFILVVIAVILIGAGVSVGVVKKKKK